MTASSAFVTFMTFSILIPALLRRDARRAIPYQTSGVGSRTVQMSSSVFLALCQRRRFTRKLASPPNSVTARSARSSAVLCKTRSWLEGGYYTTTKVGETGALFDLLQPFRMTPELWHRKIATGCPIVDRR